MAVDASAMSIGLCWSTQAPHLHNGGLAPEHFRQVLQGIFAVEISQHVLEDAYAECGAAGPIDARQFITWCRDHFFAMEARYST